jgi:tRNA G10  N-methylase Trm11
MNTYFFLLGNTPELSLLELSIFFPDGVELVNENVAKISVSDHIDAPQLMKILGGTVKILEEVAADKLALDSTTTDTSLASHLSVILADLAQSQDSTKIEFGITQLNLDSNLCPSDHQLKVALKEQDISSRYHPSNSQGVSTALLLDKNKILDLFLFQHESQIHLLKTVALQDINDWTVRDRHKPYADRKKGMLPPKVARMMVNLGANNSYQPKTTLQPLFYDPFCGTGTVIMEASMLGYQTVGSDLDKAAVRGSRENLAWLSEEYQLTANSNIFIQDVSQSIPKSRLSQKIDCLVTEPFLGKPRPQPKQVANIVKGLEKMYLGAFKNWQQILKPSARVVIVFPSIETSRHTYTLDKLIDKLSLLGYTTTSGPVEYARKQATVKRQIYVFTYQPTSKTIKN